MPEGRGGGGASHSETAALFSKQEGAGEREEEGEGVGGTAIPSNTNSNKELLSRPDNWLARVTFAACSAATRQPRRATPPSPQFPPPPPPPLTPEPWRGSSWNKHAPVSCWPLEATFLHISFLSFFLSLSGKQTGGVGVGCWGCKHNKVCPSASLRHPPPPPPPNTERLFHSPARRGQYACLDQQPTPPPRPTPPRLTTPTPPPSKRCAKLSGAAN